MENKIHPTAIVEEGTVLGVNITIGEYCIIRSGVNLGDGSSIGAFSELGHADSTNSNSNSELIIGKNARIRSRSTFYLGSKFGDDLRTGHNVTVRSGALAGQSLQLGTGTDVQGDCVIGDFVRMHSNVHVSTKSRIESFVWLYPGVVLTNDPRPPSDEFFGVTIEEYAVVAVGVTILPGRRVGRGALIAAGSVLTRDASPDCLYSGNPAKNLGPVSNLKKANKNEESAYPWRHRFHRGYAASTVEDWIAELDN